MELDSQWPSWKLLIVLNNLQRDSPNVKQELKRSISEYLVDYPPFTSFLSKISNFQQLFHFLRLISTLDKVKSDSPVHSVISGFLAEEGKGISMAKFKPSAIMKFIFESEYLSFQNMWRVNSIKFKNKKNGICSPIDPITMRGTSFFLIQFIYDKLYILGANCSVLELNRTDIKIVKDLRDVIKLCIVPEAMVEHNTGIPAQNILLSAELDFGQGDSCDQFFYEFTNVPKISIPKKYIALNYSDTTNENEEIDEDGNVPRETPDISLPEVHGESSDLGEHLVALRVETDGVFRTQMPATPQNSDPKVVVEMNEYRPPPIEDSPLALREERRRTGETAVAQSTKERQHTTNGDIHTDIGVSNSLVITKITENVGNKEKHLAETFNQPQVGTELTKLIKLPERRDISLLNSIFDPKNTSSVRKKKKVKTTWRKKKTERIVRQQQELKNVHSVVIVPTQTMSQLKQGQEQPRKANPKVTQQPQRNVRPEPSLPGENHSNFNTGVRDPKCPVSMDGPALRTRQKSSPSSTKAQTVSESRPELFISETQKGDTPTRVEGPPGTKDTPKADTRAEETASATCIDANTSILNDAFKGEQFHRQGSSMFIGDLQQQITHSILSFTESLSKKMELINEELGERILTDLSSKYRTLFAELQQNFQNDTEEMLSFIDQIKHMLKLPEPELVRLLKLRGKRS